MFYSPERLTLPIAYNALVQGMLFSFWRKNCPELHGRVGERSLSKFTFGPLEGGVVPDGRTRTIRLWGTVSMEVRSPYDNIVEELSEQVARRGRIILAEHEFPIVNLESRDRLIFPERSLVRMRAPVVAYRTIDDRGHTHPYRPGELGWYELVVANAEQKLRALGLEADQPLRIEPKEWTLEKKVTVFKRTYVTGWMGDFVVEADPQTMTVLWCLGLGSKNSDGFGMFDIVEKLL